MAYIDLHPTSDQAEVRMLSVLEQLYQTIRTCVQEVWEVPEHDIIVMAHRNTVLVQDPIAQKAGAIPELIIKINTSDTKLVDKAERLQNLIVEVWKNSFGATYPMEVWIDFFHTWGCTIDFE